MLKKNKLWQATLLDPEELGRFLTQSSTGWESVVLPIHKTFQCNKIESFMPFMKFPLPPHRKTVYDFLFLTSGTTTRGKGIDTYEINKNTFFFLPAYQIITHESMSEGVKGYYCHFDIELFNKKSLQNELLNEFPFLQYVGNPIVKIPDEVVPLVTHIMERLDYEYQNSKKDSLDIFRSYLIALFFELKRYCSVEEKKVNDSASLITQRYKEALMQRIYEFQKVSEFADILAVTPNYLNRCVQNTTGKSAHDLLNDMILLEAKALLKQSDLSISEIAYKIGKKDHSDFSRFFKAQTGMTPKEYKQGA